MGLKGIGAKVMRHGFFGSARIASRQLSNLISAPADHLERVSQLRDNDFVARFVYEGGQAIKLPQVSGADFFSEAGRTKAVKASTFLARPKHEVLLRRLVHAMYQKGVIDRRKSIVDIGAWLADNAIVWSTFLEGDAVVFAIDPAPQNIAFGKTVAVLNERHNINWVQAVCSDRSGVRLYYQGAPDHAEFNTDGIGLDSGMVTETLDQVVGPDLVSIGLLHVDVEGFEKNVLMGALGILEASRPVVLFEQHISKENVREICDLLRSKDYDVYMINEVLPGCSLDCRNFLGVQKGMDISGVLDSDTQNGRSENTWYATLGGAVVPVP